MRHDFETDAATCALVRVADPDRAFADAAMFFAPPAVVYAPGIEASACIAEDARIGEAVYIGPGCVVSRGAQIGDRCVLVAGCFVGEGAILGADCRLQAHVSIREHCRLGDRVVVHDGSVVGSDGFGYTHDEQGRWQKIVQFGVVEVGDDVEIGANVAIDRARFGKTRIGRGVKIDNLVQIAHNVEIEPDTVMAAQVGISGSTRIGRGVQLGGQAGIAGHLKVGEGSIVGAQAGVTKSVDPGVFVSGYPAMPHQEASKLHAHLVRMPILKKRVKELEEELQALKASLAES